MPKLSPLQQAARMLTKEDKVNVSKSIKEWVKKNRISEDIVRLDLDVQRFRDSKKDNTISAYKSLIYSQYNLKRYKDKEDFMKSLEDYPITELQAEVLWESYKHRDKLIQSGQYDEYRLEVFRKNYVKTLEGKGHSQDLIDAINGLSYKELRDLVIYPNARKDDANKSKLPPIGNYKYSELGKLDEISLAEEQNDIEQALYLATGRETYLDFLKKHTPKNRAYIKDEEDIDLEDEYEYYRDEVKVRFANKIDTNKKGKKYIKGIGSESGKNKKDVLRIIKIVEGK